MEFVNRRQIKKKQYFIAQHNQEDHLTHCQSGGVAFALGQVVIRKNGIVFGAKYSGLKVSHGVASDLQTLVELCGSKYVQSDIGDAFLQVKEALLKEQSVLFTGTSCQVHGLYNFLNVSNVKTDQLYTMDIICHGVPSPLMLEEYIKVIQGKYGSIVTSINMRNRKYSPKSVTTISMEDGKTIVDNNYLDLFYSDIVLRRSCSVCPYATRNKPSDITVGDTAGLSESLKHHICEANPSSIVIVHTKKGEELLRDADLKLIEIDGNDIQQRNLLKPTPVSAQRERFWNEYRKKGMRFVLSKYTGFGGLKVKIKRRILKKLGKW